MEKSVCDQCYVVMLTCYRYSDVVLYTQAAGGHDHLHAL